VTDIEADTAPPGLNEGSSASSRPRSGSPNGCWSGVSRLTPLAHDAGAAWPNVLYPPIDYQKIIYYSAPKPKKVLASLDEVDSGAASQRSRSWGFRWEEQKRLTGVAVDAVFDSVSVATTFKEALAEKGIIFCSFSEAGPEPPGADQTVPGLGGALLGQLYATLNSAVFSDGSFCYIPKGCAARWSCRPTSASTRRTPASSKRTLIVAEEGSYVSYLEDAPRRGVTRTSFTRPS